ncbi:caspase-3-like [Acanthaster planci]|uniref:Caspase-3-like n=1 Tax=Acanthaster planci TaxID=133434 RepID=A0A8B7Y998_ACAPL|nr:caspase-3-like [Acanthaster planci]
MSHDSQVDGIIRGEDKAEVDNPDATEVSPRRCDNGHDDDGDRKPGNDTMTSADTFEGYAKTFARKLSIRRKGSASKHKIPPPEHLIGDKDEDAERKDQDPRRPALSTALLADYRYDMSHRRRGTAVLINNADFAAGTDMPRRLSTGADVDGLGRALEDLGFQVKLIQDVTCGQMRRLIHLLSKEDHSDADCLLIAIMSHGEEGEIYGTDGPMPTREITTPFRGDACRSLIGKPKLFIFQACRGEIVDQGVAIDSHDVDEPDAMIGYQAARTVPVEADFLMAYSSPEGYASWRNATSGAWFIQSLVQAMEAYGHSWELTRLLTLVNRMVALQYESLSENTFMTRKKQMPCFVSTLTKELHFRPKGAPVGLATKSP